MPTTTPQRLALKQYVEQQGWYTWTPSYDQHDEALEENLSDLQPVLDAPDHNKNVAELANFLTACHERTEGGPSLKFLARQSRRSVGDYNEDEDEGHRDEPDIWCALPRGDLKGFTTLPWDMLSSVVEFKELQSVTKMDYIDQALQYCVLLHYYRPHTSQDCALLADTTHYRLCSMSGGRLRVTGPFKWADKKLLAWYLRSITSDCDLDLSPQLVDTKQKQKKRIRYNLKVTVDGGDIVLHIQTLRRGLSARKPFVGKARPCINHRANDTQSPFHKGPVIVKTRLRTTGKRIGEREIIKRIHDTEPVPGVVRCYEKEFGHSQNTKTTAPSAGGQSLGDQMHGHASLVLTTIGEPLRNCKSALHFLKVIFDLIESHRMMLEKNILHRDVSLGNALCNPSGDVPEIKEKHCFIDNLLSSEFESGRKAYGLWTDFDCAVDITDEAPCATKAEGTTMFMAGDLVGMFGSHERRSLVAGQQSIAPLMPSFSIPNDSQTNFTKRLQESPQLSSTTSAALFDELVEGYTSKVEILWSQNKRASKYELTGETTMQTGMTDMESLFYVVVLFFMRTPIVGCDSRPILNEHSKRLSNLFNDFQSRDGANLAGSIISWADEFLVYKAQLIPNDDMMKRFIAPPLRKLAVYFSIPWFLYRGDYKFHAHDYFQSLLLPTIQQMNAENVTFPVVEGSHFLPVIGSPIGLFGLSKSIHCITSSHDADEAALDCGGPPLKRQRTGSATDPKSNEYRSRLKEQNVKLPSAKVLGLDEDEAEKMEREERRNETFVFPDCRCELSSDYIRAAIDIHNCNGYYSGDPAKLPV